MSDKFFMHSLCANNCDKFFSAVSLYARIRPAQSFTSYKIFIILLCVLRNFYILMSNRDKISNYMRIQPAQFLINYKIFINNRAALS